jgi:predicted dinucleotide-binding enzyme
MMMATETVPLRVGVLGSGEVGRRLAEGFAGRGHDVMIGSRSGPNDDLAAWARGAGVGTGTFAETAEHGDLVVLAVLGVAAVEAIDQAGRERFAGKVVIDTTNPLDGSQGFPPRLAGGPGGSGGERIQAAIPEAKVVKAFNTIGNAHFFDPAFSQGDPTMFICGDDDQAKVLVAGLLADFGWADSLDVGPISASAELESLCILWVRIGARRGEWNHAFKLLTG